MRKIAIQMETEIPDTVALPREKHTVPRTPTTSAHIPTKPRHPRQHRPKNPETSGDVSQ